MSTFVRPSQEQLELNAIEALNLPDDIKSLLSLFETTPSHPTKICALAKIKNQIVISLHSPINPEHLDSPSSQPFKTKTDLRKANNINGWSDDPHNLFSRILLRFLNHTSPSHNSNPNETRLFFNVVSLAIKHFYDEQEFKYLFNTITDLIDHHRDKVQTALEFFEQVISTLQYNDEGEHLNTGQELHSKISHCHFERHFTTNHLNSMLMIANFLLEKSILRDNEAIEDGITDDSFRIRSSEEQLLAIFSLLHRVLSFDFIGEKFGESEELSEWGSIIIPTKSIRPNTFSSFETWVKNSEWIRIYQFIYGSCQLLKLKLVIIDILGDMSRIHMKYFKNKGNYRIHIENVIFALADILEQTKISVKSEEALQIALAIGRNLLKLTAPSVLPLFFEIAPNITKGLLDNIGKFLIEEIINEEVLNVNIIYYFFKFLENLYKRTKFEKNNIPEEIIDQRLREIGRTYELYLRNMIKKIFKQNYSRNNDNYHHRYDYINLKDIFKNYDITELLIFFMPFRIMKPRYANMNSIYELLVYICAKFIRSIYILEGPRLQNWQRDISITSITQCIDKVIEWQSFTSYHKKLKGKTVEKQGKYSQLFLQKTHYAKLNMELIREEYQEEIQNEYQYCHFLRVICFCMVQILNQKESIFLNRLNNENTLYKLMNIILELVFKSDLDDPANEQHKNSASTYKIHYFLEECYLMVSKLLVKEFEYNLLKVMRSNEYKYKQFYYRYAVEQTDIQFIEVIDIKQKMRIIQCIDQLKERSLPQQYTPPLLALQFLLIYSVSLPLKKELTDKLYIKNINYCLTYLQVIQMNTTLLALIHQHETILFTFLQGLNLYLENYQFKSLSNNQIMAYFKCLNIIINLNINEFSEEALNKTYVGLKSLLYYMNNEQKTKLDQQFCKFLEMISKNILNRSNDLQFIELRDQIIQVITRFEITSHKQTHHEQKMEIEETIQDTVQLQFSETKSPTNIVNKTSTNQKQNTSINGQHHTTSEKKPLQIQIYNGYHREKTLSIMDRYLMEEKDRQIELIQNISVHSQNNPFLLENDHKPSQLSQDIPNQSEQQIFVRRSDDASQGKNKEQPMDIQTSIPENEKIQERKEDFQDDESQINNENNYYIEQNNQDINQADGSCSQEQPHQLKELQHNSNHQQISKQFPQYNTLDNINIFVVNQQPQNGESKQPIQSAQETSSITVTINSSHDITEQEKPKDYQTNTKIAQMTSQQIHQETMPTNQQPLLNLTNSQNE